MDLQKISGTSRFGGVEGKLELFAHFEERRLLVFDLDGLACPRVSSHTALIRAVHKGSEPSDFDSVVLNESVDERVKNSVDDSFGFDPSDIALFSDEID